jgi:tetratricopeptide (TPR) repeat protein
MFKKFLIIILSVIAVNTFAVNHNVLLDSAETAYMKKDYDRAIAIYEEVSQGKYLSGDLFYNLANAYYKSGNFPFAILNYEKALKFEPRNEDYIHNLKIANTHIVDKIEELQESLILVYTRALVNVFSSNTWAVLGITFFVLFLALIYVYIFSNVYGRKRRAFIFSIPMFIIFGLSVYFSNFQMSMAETKYGIVTAPYVNVKSAPESDGTDLFLLHEGIKVKYEDTGITGWVKIKIKDGNKGWVKTETLGDI